MYLLYIGRSWSDKFKSQLGHITIMEIDYKIISTVFLPLPLIQEGHLSVNGKTMWTKYWLTT